MPGPFEPSRASPSGLPRLERMVMLGGLAIGLPALLAGALTSAFQGAAPAMLWSIWAAGAVGSVLLARWHCRRLMFPLYTLNSLLDALREGDYSLRGASNSVLGEMIYDFNTLADRVQRERIQFEEATHLLSKTLSSLDSAVFTFDYGRRLRLANPAGQQLLVADGERLLGKSAAELGLEAWLDEPGTRVLTHTFPKKAGRFEVRHTELRSEGRSGHLLVINDVSRVLREEEREAWQRLLRVLGHEVNNSLAPIHSMAGTLSTLLRRDPMPADWRADFGSGLDVIGHRAESLARFLSSCSQLARLPPPSKRGVDLAELANKLVRLEQRLPIRLESVDPVQVQADPDQLAQALINLLHNAVDATHAPHGGVRLRWHCTADRVVIEVEDDGPGPPETNNLFIPFFTTKAGGAGIGLALSRHIAEAHQGGLTLTSRRDAPGALASLWLPLTTGSVTPAHAAAAPLTREKKSVR